MRYATLGMLSAVALGGCTALNYGSAIAPSPALSSRWGGPRHINVDAQASFVQVTSDSGIRGLPTQRYDRLEMLSAVRGAWEGSFAPSPRNDAQPVRLIVLGDLHDLASQVASGVLHGTTSYVTALFGVPIVCADSTVTLVLQTQSGATFVGRGTGNGCAGLYYPTDQKMQALAEGIQMALADMQPIPAAELETVVPSVLDIPIKSQGRQFGLTDSVVWPVQPTPSFPQIWGEQRTASLERR